MHIILWDSICLKSPNFWKDGLKLLLSPDTVLEKKKNVANQTCMDCDTESGYLSGF